MSSAFMNSPEKLRPRKPLRGKTKAAMNYRTPKVASFNGIDWSETGEGAQDNRRGFGDS